MAAEAQKRGLPPQLPVMASLVESGIKNLSGGDRDSVGFFQMRVGTWNQGAYAGFPDKPELQVKWFLDQAEAVKAQRVARGQSVTDPNQFGNWIADIERPAEQYRGRYQLRLGRGERPARAARRRPGAAPVAAAAPRGRTPAAAAPAVAAPAGGGGSPLGAAALQVAETQKGVREVGGANMGPQVDHYLEAAGRLARQPVVRVVRHLVAGAGRAQDAGRRLGRRLDVGAQRRAGRQRPEDRQRRPGPPRRHRRLRLGRRDRLQRRRPHRLPGLATSTTASSRRSRATTPTRSTSSTAISAAARTSSSSAPTATRPPARRRGRAGRSPRPRRSRPGAPAVAPVAGAAAAAPTVPAGPPPEGLADVPEGGRPQGAAAAKSGSGKDSQAFLQAVKGHQQPAAARCAAGDPRARAAGGRGRVGGHARRRGRRPRRRRRRRAPTRATTRARTQIAAWMAAEAQKRGLPPELPVMASLVESGHQEPQRRRPRLGRLLPDARRHLEPGRLRRLPRQARAAGQVVPRPGRGGQGAARSPAASPSPTPTSSATGSPTSSAPPSSTAAATSSGSTRPTSCSSPTAPRPAAAVVDAAPSHRRRGAPPRPGAVRRRGHRRHARTPRRWRCCTTRTSCSTPPASPTSRPGASTRASSAVLTKLSQDHKLTISGTLSRPPEVHDRRLGVQPLRRPRRRHRRRRRPDRQRRQPDRA